MKKILIVEDVPDNAELARKILASRGYEVLQAENAESGFQSALDHRPDLILLDLGLPDHDGLTLASWLRASDGFENHRIVAYTAWPPDTAREMSTSYGCDGFVAKPIISVVEFLAQIEPLLA